MRRICSLLFVLLVIVGLIWRGDWRISAQSSSLRLTQLETNDAAQALGIDDRMPRFSWVLDSKRRGILQTAFRVLMASKPEFAREGRADIWDSKQVSSADAFVIYAGPDLKSRARYVLPVLTETGHHDVAVRVATQTSEPSWGYWTDRAKFTALGEHWPADTRSRNHHFFGTIVQWFYEDLAGIRPLEPGFKKVEFKPQIPTSGLDKAAVSYESARGTVASRWQRTANGLELDITVPANAKGRVYIPARDLKAVTETASGKAVPADKAESVKLIGSEGNCVVYEVGSGRYQFRVAK